MNQSQLLLDISTHALLHLEFKKLEQYLGLAERNQLLVRYLKRIVKSSRYREVKKSIKQWLLLGRQQQANFENILRLEQERLVETCSSDMHYLVSLIEQIESELKTKVQYSLARDIDLNARYGKVLVCIVDEDLSSNFDDEGFMFKSTQILFIGSPEHKDVFSNVVEKNDHFQSVAAYEDDNHLRIELLRV